MRYLALSLLAVATLFAAQGKRAFSGTVTDDECNRADHAGMRMGPTDAACAVACVEVHGGRYVLFDGNEIYQLSDQDKAKQFAGGKVTVSGTLDANTKTIQVDSIEATN